MTPNDTATIHLIMTGSLIVGSAVASAYKVLARLDKIAVQVDDNCRACAERHACIDDDINSLGIRIGHVETDVTDIKVKLAGVLK